VGAAVGISLNETGAIDIERIVTLTGKKRAEVMSELKDKKLAFLDPSFGWKQADEYLSGNVRRKLVIAQEAAKNDDIYKDNVDALLAVQPDDVSHADIEVKLGAGWVPPSDVADFAGHLLSAKAIAFSVSYIPSQGSWLVYFANHGGGVATSATAREVWGTPRKDFMELLSSALNNKSIAVYDKDHDGNSVLNREATDAANAKVQDIKTAFKEWIWESDDRRTRLHRFYNDNFNNVRPIAYNGSHQTFPGKNPAIKLRKHQINFVWQVVTTGKGLAAHEVGTGKTFSMVTAAMEMRRLGLARKPAIACLKANIESVVADALLLYPGAKIITTLDRFDAAERKRTAARIATGDYDLVIMTHDNLDMLDMSKETVKAYIEEEIDELETARLAAAAADGKKSNRVVKELEKAKARLETRLKDALDEETKDDAVTFEQTGIDFLFVDEAHKYKSLPVYTKQDRIKGIPNSRSDRATSMAMRTRWLMERQQGRGVVFATGTPVANTMAELYTMQKYLQPNELRERGLWAFDAWSAAFGDVVTKMEFTVSGYKQVSRFAKFVNIPELMQITRQVMDVQLAKDLREDDGSPSIVRPKRVDKVIIAPLSSDLASYMRTLESRAKADKKGGKDNMLLVCTDGRKAALDMRLVDPAYEDDPNSKLNLAVNKVLEIHKANPDITQMIFSDLGIGSEDGKFSVYQDVISKLVEGGIPKNRIADFSKLDGEKKDAAIQGMRDGKILVAIGSTDKLGTGVNAQKKLAALHNLDVPWLPASVEQRDGRGVRQGNDNKQVDIYRYVTEGSLDQTFWQIISNKSAFMAQVIKGEVKGRIAHDDDGEELSPEQLMAAASGDPRIMEMVTLNHDVTDLTKAKARHEREQAKLRDSVRQLENDLPRSEAYAAKHREDANTVAAAGVDFAITINGKTYTDREKAKEALETAISTANANYDTVTIGKFKGLSIVKKGETLSLNGKAEHSIGPSLNSIEVNARNIDKRAKLLEDGIPKKREDIERVRKNIGKVFKGVDELTTKRERVKALEKELTPKKEGAPKENENEEDADEETNLQQLERIPGDGPTILQAPKSGKLDRATLVRQRRKITGEPESANDKWQDLVEAADAIDAADVRKAVASEWVIDGKPSIRIQRVIINEDIFGVVFDPLLGTVDVSSGLDADQAKVVGRALREMQKVDVSSYTVRVESEGETVSIPAREAVAIIAKRRQALSSIRLCLEA
jgi:N12 class adenine-specific DNA methylase